MTANENADRSPVSPRTFLRARRPERFSDSVRESRPSLDRALLEYHLGSITSRSQEVDFQSFVRQLLQKTVCPNLLPQTGPTGGGDSKVDTETYPVADSLSQAWYVGQGRDSASEKWAFAISAKRKWRDKLHSDVKSIAGTNRAYTKIFFISNQYIPDKKRAELEGSLGITHKTAVHIFDRTWILDSVFYGHHELLAIESLRLQASLRTDLRRGPLDTEREQQLSDVENRIAKASENSEFGFQFVDDCCEAARLSRSLERSRIETDGRFARAQRAATQFGTHHQKLVAAYDYAWTAYWFYEDFALTSSLYEQVELLAKNSQNSYELELLSNLWHTLFAMSRLAQVEEGTLKYSSRTRTLDSALCRLSSETQRPSAALHAQSLLAVMRLLSVPQKSGLHIASLTDVFKRSDGLVGFPIEPLVEILIEQGDCLGDRPGYDALLELIVQVSSKRKGEIAAAKILYRRAAQQLDADDPCSAIRTVGRTLMPFFKHESRRDLVRALSLCAAAYERIGLLWAARGTALTAASVATDEYWKYSDVTPLQAACYRQLKWIELQLGRVPQILAWHNVDTTARSILAQQGYSTERLIEFDDDFDGILGILILNTDVWQLKWLSHLPDVLDGLSLPRSAVALKYALGYSPTKVAADTFPESATADETLKSFLTWRDQPAGRELPATPDYGDATEQLMTSKLLGCRIELRCSNDYVCIAVAESIIAALESTLATAVLHRIMARETILTIKVRRSSTSGPFFSHEIKEFEGRPDVFVSCGDFDPNSLPPEAQNEIRNQLTEVVAAILARTFVIASLDQVLTKLFGDDLALVRATAFCSSFVTLGNVLGSAPRTDISHWKTPQAFSYELKRSVAWDNACPKPVPTFEEHDGNAPVGDNASLIEAYRSGRVSHRDIEAISVIRESLWNEAKWQGTGYFFDEGESMPPGMGMVFNGIEASTLIFKNWRQELGPTDSQERLRISIIRGILRHQPHAYRIVVGSDLPESASRRTPGLLSVMQRIHTMEPDSSFNLDSFLRCYTKFGCYFLYHCMQFPGESFPRMTETNSIQKTKLLVRNAWEIGPNDLDSVAIQADDDPIIPDDQSDPPVRRLLTLKAAALGN